MQSYVGSAAAFNNVAHKALEISDAGRVAITLCNQGPNALLASYYSKLTGKNLISSADTKYAAENVYDGDSLDHLPIAPGSLVLTSSGVPTLCDRDGDGVLRVYRSLTDRLSYGINGATSVPATRTLTSAGINFTTAGVVAGDRVVLSASLSSGSGGCPDAGEYTVVTVGTTTLVVNRNFPTGSLSNVQFEVYPVDIVCGSINYFTGKLNLVYPSSPSTASPTYRGSVLGNVATPFVLAPNDTITMAIDGAGPVTATFTAVKAEYPGDAGSFAASAGSNMVVKIDDGAAQTLLFTATEDTIAEYVNKINDQLDGGYAAADLYALPSMMGYLNDLLTAYNAHMADTTYHDVADTNTAAGSAADLASAIVLANSLRTNYRAHLLVVSELEEAITLANELTLDYEAHRILLTAHLIADAVNVMNPALSPCTDYATAVALATELKTRYNAHLTEAGVHVNDDVTNVVTSVTPVTSIVMLKALLNEIKADYNAHLLMTSGTDEAILLANELYDDYEAHRVSLAYHDAADAVNVVNPALYPATDQVSAILLINDIRTCYLAHRSEAGVHANNDAGNNIASGACADYSTMETLCNQAKVALNGHLLAAISLDEVNTLANEFRTDFDTHIADLAYHTIADPVNDISAVPAAADYATALVLVNAAAVAYEAHRVQPGVHAHNDTTNTIAAINPATDIDELILLANDLKAKYNAHIIGVSGLEEGCTLLNEIRTDYEAHRVVIGGGVHGQGDDVSVVNPALPAASSLATAAALANELYAQYEAHRVVVGGHTTGAFGGCAFANRTTGAFGGCAFTTPGGTDVTLTDASTPFLDSDVGRDIVVANATSPANDGTFTITAVAPGGGSCTYTNAAGVAEAFAGATVGTLTSMTITDGSNPFVAADVGKDIVVTNATTPANDGTFTITDYAAGYVIYTNAAGVAEAFGAGTVGTVPNVHGIADPTNVVNAALFPCPATEAGIALAANDLKAKYNAHHILALGGVHGIADPGNTTSSPDVGTADVHIIDDITNGVVAADAGTTGIHKQDDVADAVTSPDVGVAGTHCDADVTNPATSADIGTAAVHMMDDVTNDLVAAAASDLGTLQTLVADLYVKYPLHLANVGGWHKLADTTNVTSVTPHIITLFSSTYGKTSKVEVVSGTADLLTKIGFIAGSATGVAGSNVNDIQAVTVTEAKTICEAAATSDAEVAQDGTYCRITSDTANAGVASSIAIGGTARTKIGFDAATHTGADVDADQYVVAEYIATASVSADAISFQQISNPSNDVVTMKLTGNGGATAKISAELVQF